MEERITEVIGLDLSDTSAELCALDPAGGDPLRRDSLELTRQGVQDYFADHDRARVIIEAGTHSPWLSRQLRELGHEVVIADPRRLRLVTENVRKSDYTDSELLARMGRVDDLELIRPVDHRAEQLQADYALAKVRDQLVKARTALITMARGMVKSMGGRLPSCSTCSFAKNPDVFQAIPELLWPALQPLMSALAYLTERIKEYDRAIEAVLTTRYAEINAKLRPIKGVGPVTVLCFICVIQDPNRFDDSRQAGAYVGMTPGRKQSGESDPRRGITKCGDALLRCQLTRAAHYIMTFGEDSDLRRFAQRLLARGKPRQVVGCAIGRKLAVLMHRLWVGDEPYKPLYRDAAPLKVLKG